MDLRAAIFDMDGTLVDNMQFHARAWMMMADRLGITLSLEVFEREMAGRKNEDILPALLGRELERAELLRLAGEKEACYRELYRPHVAPVAGLVAFLDALEGARVPCAVASAAPAENRAMVLDALGMKQRFASVVGAEDAPRGKPAPDLFLAAANALQIAPKRCVAFEDSVNGILAARAAGMVAVGIETMTSGETLRDAGAQWTARDYATLPDEVRALLA